jgi:outer membrane protein
VSDKVDYFFILRRSLGCFVQVAPTLTLADGGSKADEGSYHKTWVISITWFAPIKVLLPVLRLRVLRLLVLPLLVLPSAAYCFGSSDSLSIPDGLEDPLFTRPPTLKFGPVLPDGAPIQCPANVDLTNTLAIDDVIDLALCNNPQIKQAWAQIKIQAGALGEAKSAYLPTANATYSPQQTQVNYPQFPNANSITNGHMAYANLNWRLFDFGGRSANRRSSNLLLNAALASHDAAIQKAMENVIQRYFDVLTNGASVKAKSDATLFAKSSWEATLRREIKGVSAKSDSLQAEAALAKTQLASSRAQGDYRKAYAELIFVMGLPTNSRITLQEPQERAHKQDFKDLNSWLDEAQHEHPGIKSAKAQWESAKEKITAARSAGLPTIDLMGNFYQNGYPNQGLQPVKSNTTTVGLSLTIPIFEGFSTTYKIRGAQAQAEQAQAQFEDTKHQILMGIVKSHADATSSLANLESSQALLKAANAALTSAVKRYDSGVVDILELLNSQRSLAEAQEERIRCIAEWRSARLRLMANAGVLGRVDEVQNKP